MEANKPNENNQEQDKNKKSIFDRTELLFKRIAISNTPTGTHWKCEVDNCTYNTDEKEKIRNHLAQAHRKTKTGVVYCPYCNKKQAHIGNLKQHLTGFIGKKCELIQPGKKGEEIWEDTIRKNPRGN